MKKYRFTYTEHVKFSDIYVDANNAEEAAELAKTLLESGNIPDEYEQQGYKAEYGDWSEEHEYANLEYYGVIKERLGHGLFVEDFDDPENKAKIEIPQDYE